MQPGRSSSVGVWFVFVFAVSSIAASCGETNIQAIERLRPLGASFRSRLAEIARSLPAPGTETEQAPSAFNPSLVVDTMHEWYSADILMEEQLVDPDRSDTRFDLILSPALLSCLLWTGPKNPLDQSVWNERTDLGPECEAAFRVRYLVVVRTLAVDIPERVSLYVFVVDLHSGELRARFPISLLGTYQKADVGRGRFASEAVRQLRSDAFVVARCELARKLGRMPAARVDLREHVSGSDPCSNIPGTFRIEPARQVAKE